MNRNERVLILYEKTLALVEVFVQFLPNAKRCDVIKCVLNETFDGIKNEEMKLLKINFEIYLNKFYPVEKIKEIYNV